MPEPTRIDAPLVGARRIHGERRAAHRVLETLMAEYLADNPRKKAWTASVEELVAWSERRLVDPPLTQSESNLPMRVFP